MGVGSFKVTKFRLYSKLGFYYSGFYIFGFYYKGFYDFKRVLVIWVIITKNLGNINLINHIQDGKQVKSKHTNKLLKVNQPIHREKDFLKIPILYRVSLPVTISKDRF